MRKNKKHLPKYNKVLKSIVKMKGDLWLIYKCKMLVAIKK